LWQDSWQAWRARPWLGWGPENFEAAVGRYLSPELTSLENYSLDRAHNFIFDYGVANGWLGLLGYLGLFVSAGWCLFKIARHQAGQRLGAMVLGSLLVGYLGQNFFIFDTFISYLMLFFVLSFINFRCVPSAEKEMEKTLNKIKNILSIKYFVLVFTVSCLLLAVYFFNIKPTLASYRANQLLSLSPASADQSGVLLKDILSLKTFGSPEIVYQATIDYIIKIDQAPVLSQNEDFYKVAADALRQIIKQAPGQARNYIALAWLDLYFSNQQPGRLDEALVLAGQAKELIPNKKDAYLVLAADYALRGDKQQGQQIVTQAQQVSPVIGQEVKEYWESLK